MSGVSRDESMRRTSHNLTGVASMRTIEFATSERPCRARRGSDSASAFFIRSVLRLKVHHPDIGLNLVEVGDNLVFGDV